MAHGNAPVAGAGNAENVIHHPSEAECIALMRELGAAPGLIGHVTGVAAAAGRLAVHCRGHEGLAVAAALAHDIGKAPRAVEAYLGWTSAEAPGPLRDAAHLRQMDHGRLGGLVLRAAGKTFAALAPATERHVIGAVLTGRGPETLEEQAVFLADKMVAREWLGLRARIADLIGRYGHIYPIRSCVPGTWAMAFCLASRAAMSWRDLERMTRPGRLA
jgi:HD superfamily phosphohydrolase YqeK